MSIRIGYIWLGKISDIQSITIRGKRYVKLTHLVTNIIRQLKEIPRQELINELCCFGYKSSSIAAYLSYVTNGLENQGIINTIPYPTHLQQIIYDTSLNRRQILRYRKWLEDAGIFPSHEEAVDTYSPEEKATLRKIGEYINSGKRVIDSIRLAVKDVYGESRIEDFNNVWQKHLKESNWWTLQKERRNQERLLLEFLESYSGVLRSYPFNLYSALSQVDVNSFIRNGLNGVIRSTHKRKKSEDYRSNVFAEFIDYLEELSSRLQGLFEIILDRATGINKQETERLRRSIEVVRSRYMIGGKVRTLKEVGKEIPNLHRRGEIGITRERTRQLEVTAFRYLKNQAEIRNLLEHLFSEN